MSSGADAGGQRAARGHQPVDGHVPPDEAQPDAVRSDPGVPQATDLEVRPLGVLADDPADQARAGRPRGIGSRRRRRAGRAIRRPSHRSSAARTRRTPGIADVRDEGRLAVRPGPAPARSSRRTRRRPRSRRRRRRDGPTRPRSARRCRAGTGRSCPAYSSASTTKSGPLPNRATPRGEPAIDAGRMAPTNPDGSRPASTSRCRSQPDVVDLPCVPVTPMSRRPPVAAASAMTCWTLSGTMPTARAATSSGWSGWTEVTAFVTASRSMTAAPSASRTCARVVAPVDRDAGGQDRVGHRIRPPAVAGGHDRAHGRRVEGRARRGRAADARRRGSACRARSVARLAAPPGRGRCPRRCGSSRGRLPTRQGDGPLGQESKRLGGARLDVGRPIAGPVEPTHVGPEPVAHARRRPARPACRPTRHPARRRR